MYGIAVFGFMMVVISLIAVIKPEAWGQMILKFVRFPYFHPFEILIRVVFGILFVVYADQTKFPLTVEIVGFVLFGLGVGLSFITSSQHRRLGHWLVEKLSKYFRPAGLVSLTFGAFLIYVTV